MQTNKVVRFALSDSGATAALGVNLTNAEITAKTEAGVQGLLLKGSYGVHGICHDYSGNMYVTDLYRHCILKIDEGGRISIFAGYPGISGDTLATTDLRDARFNDPRGIACDRSNNIYVADTGNNKIKVINSKGVSVLAGSTAGNVDATGTSAKFNQPYDVAVDHAGRIYVADNGNNSVRKIETNGKVITLAGDGSVGDSENVRASKHISTFNAPEGVTVDREGNVYVLDTGNYKIKKIVPRGWVYLLSGSGVAGRGLGTSPYYGYTSSYGKLVSCDVDESGNLYVLDQGVLYHEAGSSSSSSSSEGEDTELSTRLIKVDYSGRPGVIADFSATSSSHIVDGVMCTPGQKLLVTISELNEDLSTSSSSSSSSESSESSSSSGQ